MGIIRRITKNYFYLSSAQIACKVFAFCAIIYLARILTPGDFGKISFVSAILSYFLLITNMGLVTLGTREIAADKERTEYYTENILSLRLILGAVSFALVCVLAFFLPQPRQIRILLVLYGLSLFPLSAYLEWVFQGIEQMGYIALAGILNYGSYLLMIVLFVKSRHHLYLIPLLWGIGNIIASTVLLRVFIRKKGRLKLHFAPGRFRELLVRALPLGFSWGMLQLYNNFDTVMLGFMRTQQEVGWYNAAYKIIMVIFSLGGFFFISLFPAIANLYRQNIEKLKLLLSYTAKLMVALACPLIAGGILLARPVMRLFFTSRYDNGVIAFQILICYVGISFIAMIYANSLLACGREKKFAIGVSIAAAVNLILNALLIPRFGLAGASLATVLGEMSLLVYSVVAFSRIIRVSFLRHCPKPLLATVLVAAVLFFTNGYFLALRMILAAAVYFAALFFMRFLSRGEFLEFKKQLGK